MNTRYYFCNNAEYNLRYKSIGKHAIFCFDIITNCYDVILLVQVTDKLYHIMLNTSPWSRFELTTSVVIGTRILCIVVQWIQTLNVHQLEYEHSLSLKLYLAAMFFRVLAAIFEIVEFHKYGNLNIFK